MKRKYCAVITQLTFKGEFSIRKVQIRHKSYYNNSKESKTIHSLVFDIHIYIYHVCYLDTSLYLKILCRTLDNEQFTI